MINEAEKLDSIFNKVKTFVNFAKNAKTENDGNGRWKHAEG